MSNLEQILQNHRSIIQPLINLNHFNQPPYIFDFTDQNQELAQIDLDNDEEFNDYVFKTITRNNTNWGLGKYNENRTVYRNSELFNNTDEFRCVHLGYDLWVPAGSPIYAPLDARVHSFANNNNYRDYGPTIILEHELEGQVFFTLYGHQQTSALENLEIGQTISAGQIFTRVGDITENGQWPPHLHFQIMTTMLNNQGDFPGVTSLEDRNKYLDICLDPGLLFFINN